MAPPYLRPRTRRLSLVGLLVFLAERCVMPRGWFPVLVLVLQSACDILALVAESESKIVTVAQVYTLMGREMVEVGWAEDTSFYLDHEA